MDRKNSQKEEYIDRQLEKNASIAVQTDKQTDTTNIHTLLHINKQQRRTYTKKTLNRLLN